jgi:hypothetical protein
MDDIKEKLAICCLIHRRQGFDWAVVLLHTNYKEVDSSDLSAEDHQLAHNVYTYWIEDTVHLILAGTADTFMSEGRTMLLGQRPFDWVFGMSLVQSYKKILRREKKTVDGVAERAIMDHH